MTHLFRKVSVSSLLLLAANLLPAQQVAFVKTPPVLTVGTGLGTAVADFNGDSIPDIAAVTSTGVSVYLGKGDGTFQPAIVTTGSYFPTAVAVGNFNNDGKQDLVVASGNFAPVLLLLGNGDGTFQAPLTIASSGSFPALGDFNGDKHLDLALYSGSSVIVLLGNGAGGFTQSTAIPVSSVGGIAVGQINGDHKLDMAVSNPNANTVSVYLGNGDGTFGSASTITVGLEPGPLAIRDLNGDTKADLAVADLRSSDVAVLLGNGDGTFQPPTANPVPVGNGVLGSFVTGDFNNDGIPDIAVVGYLLLGTGGGKFQAPVSYPLIPGAGSVVAADLNRDHKLDLVIGGQGFVSILLGKGNGSFRGAPDITVGTMPTSIAVADFNGDGLPDFVTVNQSSSSLSVALGNGHGSFSAATSVALGIGGGTFPSQIAAGDFNKDGKIDLVVGCGTPGNAGFCLPGGLAVLLGDGNGGFQAPVFIPNSEFSPTGIVVADLNNDGIPDIVVSAPESSNIFMYGVIVYHGNGNGTFQAPVTAYVADAQCLAPGDFNGDGKLDLAVGLGSSSLAILIGNGKALSSTLTRSQLPTVALRL